MTETGPPLRIELTRGRLVESSHEVRVVVATGRGPARVHGDGDALVHPRSSVKMIQALPLVESGAADAFDLGDDELALACASHAGAPQHVAVVQRWLDRIGLDHTALECGPQLGRAEGAIANNCSGKHTGFLTVAQHLGLDPAGYLDPDHPVQRRVTASLAGVLDLVPDPGIAGVDGCGIPVHPVPLASLAAGVARFATPPDHWPAERREACRRLGAAMRARPELVAGNDDVCTQLMAGVDGLIAKNGAEGVYVLGFVGRDLGVAVKATDGARRAAEAAVAAVLRDLGEPVPSAVGERFRLTNWAGTEVGEVRADAGGSFR